VARQRRALLTHPGVRLVAVTAVPDEIRGEEVKAYYVTAGDPGDTGDSDGTGPAVMAGYCRERLAGFKVPRFWQPAADLPRTDSQRVAKARLAELDGAMYDAVTGEWSPAPGR
jgi:carnitine-CoA ligase